MADELKDRVKGAYREGYVDGFEAVTACRPDDDEFCNAWIASCANMDLEQSPPKAQGQRADTPTPTANDRPRCAECHEHIEYCSCDAPPTPAEIERERPQ